MKEKILETIKKYETEEEENVVKSIEQNDLEGIEKLFNYLQEELDLAFRLYMRSSSDSMDYWLQAEYWSEKLKKTIIWSYDYELNYAGLDEIAEVISETNEEIIKFEDRITLK